MSRKLDNDGPQPSPRVGFEVDSWDGLNHVLDANSNSSWTWNLLFKFTTQGFFCYPLSQRGNASSQIELYTTNNGYQLALASSVSTEIEAALSGVGIPTVTTPNGSLSSVLYGGGSRSLGVWYRFLWKHTNSTGVSKVMICRHDNTADLSEIFVADVDFSADSQWSSSIPAAMAQSHRTHFGKRGFFDKGNRDMDVKDYAFWNRDLDDGEMYGICTGGLSPQFVSRGLVSYWPMPSGGLDTDNETDIIGGYTGILIDTGRTSPSAADPVGIIDFTRIEENTTKHYRKDIFDEIKTLWDSSIIPFALTGDSNMNQSFSPGHKILSSNRCTDLIQGSTVPTAGFFSLTINGKSTAMIAHNASVSVVQAAIDAIDGVSTGSIRVVFVDSEGDNIVATGWDTQNVIMRINSYSDNSGSHVVLFTADQNYVVAAPTINNYDGGAGNLDNYPGWNIAPGSLSTTGLTLGGHVQGMVFAAHKRKILGSLGTRGFQSGDSGQNNNMAQAGTNAALLMPGIGSVTPNGGGVPVLCGEQGESVLFNTDLFKNAKAFNKQTGPTDPSPLLGQQIQLQPVGIPNGQTAGTNTGELDIKGIHWIFPSNVNGSGDVAHSPFTINEIESGDLFYISRDIPFGSTPGAVFFSWRNQTIGEHHWRTSTAHTPGVAASGGSVGGDYQVVTHTISDLDHPSWPAGSTTHSNLVLYGGNAGSGFPAEQNSTGPFSIAGTGFLPDPSYRTKGTGLEINNMDFYGGRTLGNSLRDHWLQLDQGMLNHFFAMQTASQESLGVARKDQKLVIVNVHKGNDSAQTAASMVYNGIGGGGNSTGPAENTKEGYAQNFLSLVQCMQEGWVSSGRSFNNIYILDWIYHSYDHVDDTRQTLIDSFQDQVSTLNLDQVGILRTSGVLDFNLMVANEIWKMPPDNEDGIGGYNNAGSSPGSTPISDSAHLWCGIPESYNTNPQFWFDRQGSAASPRLQGSKAGGYFGLQDIALAAAFGLDIAPSIVVKSKSEELFVIKDNPPSHRGNTKRNITETELLYDSRDTKGNETSITPTTISNTFTDWEFRINNTTKIRYRFRTNKFGVSNVKNLAVVKTANVNQVQIHLDKQYDWQVRSKANGGSFSSWTLLDLSGEQRVMGTRHRDSYTVINTDSGVTVTNTNAKYLVKKTKSGVTIDRNDSSSRPGKKSSFRGSDG